MVPWLLAVGESYARIGEQWSCSGLASEGMSVEESAKIRRSGFDKKSLRKLKVQIDEFGNISPYLVTCSGNAKLLEFKGPMLPWRMERFDKQAPICQLPSAWHRSGTPTSTPALTAPGIQVRVWCELTTFVNCSTLWASFMSEEAACALKDFDREWQDAEDQWMHLKAEHEWKIEQAHQEKLNEGEEQQHREHLAYLKSLENEIVDDKVEKRLRKKTGVSKEKLQRRAEKKTREMEMQLQREEQLRVDRARRARLGLGVPGGAGESVAAASSTADDIEEVALSDEEAAAPPENDAAEPVVDAAGGDEGGIVEMNDFGDLLGATGKDGAG